MRVNNLRHLLVISLLSLFFLGCSQKEYFEPDPDIVKFLKENQIKKTPLEAGIKTFNRKGATLENQKIILSSGIQDIKLKDGFIFLNEEENTIISADNIGNISIGSQEIDLGKVVVSASKKDDLLALIFIDNSIGLYDISKKQMLFKEYYNESLVNDIRISNPIILKDIVLYPTLDGKVIIVSVKDPKVLRTIIVDSGTKFNNISFFQILGESLIAASANQIISLKALNVTPKEFEIRDIIIKDKYIYIATLDGQILKLDSSLNIIAKTKFKYAKIYSLGYKGDKIYALESQSYLIELNNDLKEQNIYSFKFDNDAKSILLGDKIYFQKTTLNESTLRTKTEDFYITLP